MTGGRLTICLTNVGAGTIVLADKAYDANRICASLRDRCASANIPRKANRRSKPYFTTWLYRERNLIECFFSKLKHFRRVATRYEKLAENVLGHGPARLIVPVAPCYIYDLVCLIFRRRSPETRCTC